MIKLNNFYVLLIVSIIIGSPIIFLKNDLLKSLTITEEIIIVSLGILAIVSFIYFGYEKNSLKNLISVGEKNKYKLKHNSFHSWNQKVLMLSLLSLRNVMKCYTIYCFGVFSDSSTRNLVR